tara:strand:- start:5528 stop:5953 length:426 start_codon:yes stop_codon:yes gene_type:complete
MAATDLNTVRSTIEDRIKAELATTPPVAVVFQNVPYTPTPNSSWCQCVLTFNSTSYLTQGAATASSNRIDGLVTLNVFTPKGSGGGANFTIGKRLRDLFNRIEVSGVRFDAPTGPQIIANAVPEGYYQTSLSITFEVFEYL